MERTLVIVLGQLRSATITWRNFVDNVLTPLGADLAICSPADDHLAIDNPFYRFAKYRWLIPAPNDLAEVFDQIQRVSLKGRPPAEDWRVLCDVPGHWLGGIALAKQSIFGAIELSLRWFMVDHFRALGLDQSYDRVVVTRSDFFYLTEHPPLELLEADGLWIPDGEDFGGLCPRHLIVSSGALAQACDVLGPLLGGPGEARSEMLARDTTWNVEKVLDFHFFRSDLRSRVRRFPYVMYLARSPGEPSSTTAGHYLPEAGMIVKYRSEYLEAVRYADRIKSRDDWAVVLSGAVSPGHIHTAHGTIIYVDEQTGVLKHGQLDASPRNAFVVFDGDRARLEHRSARGSRAIVKADDGRLLSCPDDATSKAPDLFDIVPIASSHWPDKWGWANNLAAFKSNDLFLAAEPGGRLIVDRPQCGTWEQFRVIHAGV